ATVASSRIVDANRRGWRGGEGMCIEPRKLGCVTVLKYGLPAVPRNLTDGQWASWVKSAMSSLSTSGAVLPSQQVLTAGGRHLVVVPGSARGAWALVARLRSGEMLWVGLGSK